MSNKDVREAAKNANIKLWEIAERFGCNDGNFSRKMRRELNQEDKEKVFQIIEEIENERK